MSNTHPLIRLLTAIGGLIAGLSVAFLIGIIPARSSTEVSAKPVGAIVYICNNPKAMATLTVGVERGLDAPVGKMVQSGQCVSPTAPFVTQTFLSNPRTRFHVETKSAEGDRMAVYSAKLEQGTVWLLIVLSQDATLPNQA